MARLVFCEDDPTIQRVIQVALRATAHEVHLAPDGAAGLALIERIRPDLIFTDLSMPEMDGYQLIRELKARPELAALPVVLMSASGAAEVAQAAAAGAVEVLAKPFGTAELRERIERLLAAAGHPTPDAGTRGRGDAETPPGPSLRPHPVPLPEGEGTPTGANVAIGPSFNLQPSTFNPSELAPLWDEFAAASRRRVDALEDAVGALLEGALEPGQRDAAEREAHRLAGSLGSFGLAEGSRLAREAEELLRGRLDVSGVPRLASLAVELRRVLDQAPVPTAPAPAGPAERRPALDARVTVVDDDPIVLELVRAILTREGARVRALASPTGLVEALAAEPPDLLMLDVDMPGLSGLELCRRLRADRRWAALPILFLTARADAESVQAAFEAGADDYVPKPIAGPELVTRLRNRLERARALGAAAGRRASAPAPGRSVDVVVVDDDEPLAGLLLYALGTRGYTTEWLKDGDEAVEALAGEAPALRGRIVLLDVNLPAVDGIGVLRRLARDGVVAGTRVIMLTARSSEAEVLKTLELGAFDHVAKPFSVPVLVQRIRRALES